MQRLVKHRFSTHYHSHASHASKQPYQKATERSGTTHSNSWKAEIKFLSAKKIPSHLCSFKWKPRHLTTMLMFSSGKKKKQQKNNFPKGRKKLIIPKLLPHILKKGYFHFLSSDKSILQSSGVRVQSHTRLLTSTPVLHASRIKSSFAICG